MQTSADHQFFLSQILRVHVSMPGRFLTLVLGVEAGLVLNLAISLILSDAIAFDLRTIHLTTQENLKLARVYSAYDADSLLATKQQAANRGIVWGFLDTLNLWRLDACSQLLSTEFDCAVRASPFLPVCVGIQGSSDKHPEWSQSSSPKVQWSFQDEYRCDSFYPLGHNLGATRCSRDTLDAVGLSIRVAGVVVKDVFDARCALAPLRRSAPQPRATDSAGCKTSHIVAKPNARAF